MKTHHQLLIHDIGTKGEGIGKLGGLTVFVDGALPKDTVQVDIITQKKNYAVGKLTKLVSPSPDRVKPPCPVAGTCGGCQIQALSYEAQLKWKHQKVKDSFQRIAGLPTIEVLPVLGMADPFHYRNKAQFPVSSTLQLG